MKCFFSKITVIEVKYNYMNQDSGQKKYIIKKRSKEASNK